jgi:hypothetical protein
MQCNVVIGLNPIDTQMIAIAIGTRQAADKRSCNITKP